MPEQQQDFIAFLTEMRSGEAISHISSEFNDLLQAVINNGGPGKFTLTIALKPEKLDKGKASEVSATYTHTIKAPTANAGRSMFFVHRSRLTREDPRQMDMFNATHERESK